MVIIGADCHPAFQQIAFVDAETGELQERRLERPEGAEKFYRDLAAPRTWDTLRGMKTDSPAPTRNRLSPTSKLNLPSMT